MNYLITPRGERQEAAPKDGVAFTVTELQDMVGGWIDIKEIGDNHLVVFDVDGARKDKLYNKTATELIRKAWVSEDGEPWNSFVAGNAVICTQIRVD